MENVKSKLAKQNRPIDPSKFKGRPVNRLREYRKAKGWTQAHLASKIDVNKVVICQAERYGRHLGEDKWYRLADIFDVDPRVLKGYTLPAENS